MHILQKTLDAPAEPRTVTVDRRSVLKAGAAVSAGFVLATYLPLTKAEAARGNPPVVKGPGGTATYAPNAFLEIGADDTVTVLSKHIEFGQGPYTGLATLVAEEMDADWSQMRARGAPADNGPYKNLLFGLQVTGGSTAIANSYEHMRTVGAAARQMLVEAAAEAWKVPAGEITVKAGRIEHAGSGRSSGFGALAEAARQREVPPSVTLKDPADFKLIGRKLPRLDSRAKVTGQAQFTIDVTRPGMLTVLIARPPRFGAKPVKFDDAEARKIKGVVDVHMIPQGVAVYATGFWAAKKGRDALQVTWDESNVEKRSSPQIIADYIEMAGKPGAVATDKGDAAAAIQGAARRFKADFTFPFLAHAPMEPLDCVMELREDGAEAWYGAQMPGVDQGAIAKVLGFKPEQVTVNVMFAGGSFGRRAQPAADLAVETAAAIKALGRPATIKLMWTREDDIQGGLYRPIYVHRLEAGLDDKGTIVGWNQTIVGQSIVAGGPFASMIKDGIDPTSVEGARDLPYDTGAFRVSLHSPASKVPALWWRSVGHTHTAYATEVFLDQLFEAAGKDPIEGRLALLGDNKRHAGVLRTVAKLANWSADAPKGRARGVGLHKSFNSYVAQIVEVSRSEDDETMPRVHKVWCAVDCGRVVNPDIVRAQMEGGIGFGLSAVLFNAIDLKDGVVQQANFDTYRSLRINEMPDVEVAIVPSSEAPTGVGEPGVPPIGAAVANAWAKLTGKRFLQQPFERAGSA